MMDRPRRERKPVIKFEAATQPTRTSWTLLEKEHLLAAIKKHGQDDITRLSKAMNRKNSTEIKSYMETLQQRCGSARKYSVAKDSKAAPIETWLRLMTDLVAHDADYSDAIAQVFSICGNLEPHMPPRNLHGVNYNVIYRYLAGLLHGERIFPKMNQISAAVLLDVLQSLADKLGTLELDVQRQLMEEKYRLLKGHVPVGNKLHHEATRRALENDVDLTGMMAPGVEAKYPHSMPRAVEPNARWNTNAGKRSATQPKPSCSQPKDGSPCATAPAMVSTFLASHADLAPNSGVVSLNTARADKLKGMEARQVQLKLPAGMQVSPGSYRLSAQHLQALMRNLRQVPKALRVETRSDAGKALQAGLVQGVQHCAALPATLLVQKSGTRSADLAAGTPCQVHGRTQGRRVDGATSGTESNGAPSAKQSVQEAADGHRTANPRPGEDLEPQSAAEAGRAATSSETAGELGVLDGVAVSKGTKRKSTTPLPYLPKRTQLFSLNPLCIPVHYLKPVKKELSPK